MILDKPCIEERRIVIRQCNNAQTLPCKFPRRCFVSGKWLFMKEAVRVSREIVTNYSTDRSTITQRFWVDPKEYTLIILGIR